MATFKKVVTETNADTIAQSTTGSAATLTTARAIALSGNITGTANFDGSAGISISSTLADSAVATAKIADTAVTTAKIANDAITQGKIADDAIGPDQLASSSINHPSKFADDVVTAAAIGANAVGASELNVGSNGTSGQVLASDGDGTFSWVDAQTGDITTVGAGTGLNGGGASGDVTINLDNTITNVTSLTNDALLVGVSSNKPRIKFDFDGTPTEGRILFGIDSDTDTMEFINSGTASANQDILRPTANRSVQLGSSSNTWEDIHTRSIRTVFFHLNGTQVTSTAAELNILDGVTATKDEINLLDGVTATTAELNYVDGVTSNVQTQLNAKAPLASPSFTGNVTIGGDLTVSGATITTSTETLEIADNTLILNSDLGSSDAGVDAGFVVERGSSGDNAAFFYDNSDASWKVGTSSSQALPSDGARIALQSVKASLDTTDESVPVGGFQVAGGVAYVRTA